MDINNAPISSKKTSDAFRNRPGFSLAEVLTALTIGAMVLVAILGIYSRAENSAAAVTTTLDNSRLPSEILQRIAEDLDRVLAAGLGTKITINNKLESGFSAAQLKILKIIYDKKNKAQVFEEIIWQTGYDNESASLVLYRSHRGLALEDKLLEAKKEKWARELFVPICKGLTFFQIQVPKGLALLDKWTDGELPKGIVVTISFAEPVKTISGTLDVPDAQKITRTIAVDRTRKIKFDIVKKAVDEQQKQQLEQQPEQKQEQSDE